MLQTKSALNGIICKVRRKGVVSGWKGKEKQPARKEKCEKMKKKPIIFLYLAEKQYLCSPKSRISDLHIINIYNKTTWQRQRSSIKLPNRRGSPRKMWPRLLRLSWRPSASVWLRTRRMFIFAASAPSAWSTAPRRRPVTSLRTRRSWLRLVTFPHSSRQRAFLKRCSKRENNS